MKIKIKAKLRKILTRHFVNQIIGQVGVPIKVQRDEITRYWLNCPKNLKHTSLCFFSKELIDLVNKTNSKLLYADLLRTAQNDKPSSSSTEDTEQDDYSLLNTFEMLWNIEG